MNGIDKDMDFSFIVHKTVIQVAFGLFQVQLNMTDDVQISIESKIKFKSENSDLNLEPPFNDADCLLKLLDKSIIEIRVIDQQKLILVFEDNIELYLIDSSTCYESFTISHGNSCIVV